MNEEEFDQKKPSRIPTIKADSESQTSGHLIVLTPEKDNIVDMESNDAAPNVSSIRKRRNLSKNRGQATKQREQTPEPGRMGVQQEDTTTSDEDAPPRSSREIEAENTYKEMMRLVQEQTCKTDPDDIDIDEIRERRVYVENERRRRSISPFALPTKEEIAKLQRKGSFVDPNNKLLTTTYTLSPKEDNPERRNSLTIDTAQGRRSSLTPPTPNTGSPREAPFAYPSPPSPRKQAEILYPDEIKQKKQSDPQKKLLTPVKTDTSDVFTFENKDVKPKPARTPTNVKPETPVPGELVTKVIQVERTPSKKLTQENKPVVEVKAAVSAIERTPSRKLETKPTVIQRQSVKQKEELPRAPPVKPARSKSASRFGGKTSESEMSEDQGRFQNDSAKATKKKTVATPRRFIKNKSPGAKRSQSVTRVEDLADKTGTGMSQTSHEIIQLLQQARARSLSIPKDDKRTPMEYIEDQKRRILMTPNARTPASRSARGISCPKTIQIISQKEILAGLSKTQKLELEFEKSRNTSGYVDASQSEYTSSCYSTSPSENEFDFNLTDKAGELARKLSILSQEMETRDNKLQTEVKLTDPAKKSSMRKRSSVNNTKESKKEKNKIVEQVPKEEVVSPSKYKFMIFFREWRAFKTDHKMDYDAIKAMSNRCLCDIFIVIIFCGVGGLLFKNLEGSFESAYKCGTRNVKRDFIEHLWKGSHYLREEDWKSMARNKLHEFEDQLHTAHEAGVTSFSGQRSWNFMNSFVYCLTVISTIGYGHIVPSTTYGRLATIFYAVIGIPLFLIVLADFGKLFTRIIKFFWAFIRRVYYTGSCRKVRKTVPMVEMMKGFNIVYDVVRRPSQMLFEEEYTGLRRPSAEAPPAPPLEPVPHGDDPPPLPPKPRVTIEDPEIGTEPETPAPSVFEIDDEFNLPISVAIIILIGYIFVGATVYMGWEEWTFFESFYFVFISMSTIGFGDFVPRHPIFMMCSILYLVFGLALTSMCINVVQDKLSDTFRRASAKLGATIGLRVAEEDGGLVPITPQAGDIAPVHKARIEVESPESNKEEYKED